MLSNLVQLTHTVENKACQFICANDTPINVIKEALFQFQKFIGTVEDQAKAQQEAQKQASVPAPEEAPVADPVPAESA